MVFERAQGIEDGGGFFGDEAVFDDAVVAREIDDAFGAQACEVVGDAGWGGVECLCQFGNAAVAVKQQKKDGHAFGVGKISLRMVERRLISMFLFLLLYERLMLVKLG